KQSYSVMTGCMYPAGFVEPIPHFWDRLEKMATNTAELIEKTPYPDLLVERPAVGRERGGKDAVRLRDVQKKQIEFFRNFAKQVALLKSIVAKQQAQK